MLGDMAEPSPVFQATQEAAGLAVAAAVLAQAWQQL
jgi:hypothetical protein